MKKQYLKEVARIIQKYIGKDAGVFVFGSFLKRKFFHDIDVGIIGKGIDEEKMALIRDDLENSLIPYKIDLVNFNKVEKKFKEEVFRQKILWLIFPKKLNNWKKR